MCGVVSEERLSRLLVVRDGGVSRSDRATAGGGAVLTAGLRELVAAVAAVIGAVAHPAGRDAHPRATLELGGAAGGQRTWTRGDVKGMSAGKRTKRMNT